MYTESLCPPSSRLGRQIIGQNADLLKIYKCLYNKHDRIFGRHRSNPELVKELTDPCAGFGMKKIPTTGDLLTVFCKNPHAPALYGGEKQPDIKVGELTIPLGRVRSPMTAAISKDGGETWGCFRDITSDPEGVYGDYGYPGITWIKDGEVALVNYHALDGIRLARIGVDWFYGK